MGVVGRVLLVSIFLLSGLAKLGDDKPHVETLGKSYEKWHGWVAKNTGVDFPVKPDLIQANAPLIIKATGVTLIIGAVLCVLDIPFGSTLLILFLMACNLLIHFPPMYSAPEQEFHMINFLKNTAIMGGLMFIGSSKNTASSEARPVSTGRQGKGKRE